MRCAIDLIDDAVAIGQATVRGQSVPALDKIAACTPIPFAERLSPGQQFPLCRLRACRGSADVDIIAGCAPRRRSEPRGEISRARVLAIRLSLSSLAYAKRVH